MRKSFLTSVSLVVLVLTLAAVGWACQIRVSDDTHVQPVAEFTGSGGYPDIVTLENNALVVTSIPKRGRVIHSLVLKATGNDLLYNTKTTLPMDDAGVSFFELGGLYFSAPWNPRDDQPYDLDYEILEHGEEKVSIRLWGQDFDTGLQTEFVLTLEEDKSSVEIAVVHENLTGETFSLPIWDRFLLRPGTPDTGIELLLPVENIRLVNDQEEQEADLEWPGNLNKWEDIDGYTRFLVKLSQDAETQLGAKNVETGEKLIIKGEDHLFTKLEVLTYGPNFRRYLGAFPGFRITRRGPEILFQPGTKVEYRIELEMTKD